MDLQNVEAVVRRLFSDSEFRAAAIASPSTAMAEFDLASDQKVALGRLCESLKGDESLGVIPDKFWF